MSLKLGSTDINGLYLGSTAINQAYLGSTEIFSAGGGDTISTHATLTNDLVAAYPFDTDANDVHNSNHLTVSGAALTTGSGGKIGEAYDYDGINDRLYNVGVNITTAHTISVWVYNEDKTAHRTVFHHSNGTTKLDMIWYSSQNGARYACTGGGTIYPTSALNQNQWYHIMAVSNGTTMELFIDNVSQGTASIGTWTGGSREINFGSLTNPIYYWKGFLDNGYIWNRALTSDERDFVHNSGDGRAYN